MDDCLAKDEELRARILSRKSAWLIGALDYLSEIGVLSKDVRIVAGKKEVRAKYNNIKIYTWPEDEELEVLLKAYKVLRPKAKLLKFNTAGSEMPAVLALLKAFRDGQSRFS
jgi:hypothetical protein